MAPDNTVGGTSSIANLLADARADFQALMGLDEEPTRSLRRRQLDALTLPGYWAVVIFRVSAVAHRRGILPLARFLFLLNIMLFSCEISPRAEVGEGFIVPHPQGVAIGGGVRLGKRVRILRGVGLGTAGYKDISRDGFPDIGDDCILFDGVKIFGPVVVGARTRIGTSVVLLESVPADALVTAELPYKVLTRERAATPSVASEA